MAYSSGLTEALWDGFACAVPRRSEGTEPWRAEMARPNQLSATKYLSGTGCTEAMLGEDIGPDSNSFAI